MKWVIWLPYIIVAIFNICIIITALILKFVLHKDTSSTGPLYKADWQDSTPIEKGKDIEIPNRDQGWAEKFDSRLTNIFRNPFEGIL